MASPVVAVTDTVGDTSPSFQGSTLKLLVTIREAGEILSMGRTLIFDEIRRGRIKTVKPSRITLIPVDYLREYVELLKVEAERSAA